MLAQYLFTSPAIDRLLLYVAYAIAACRYMFLGASNLLDKRISNVYEEVLG